MFPNIGVFLQFRSQFGGCQHLSNSIIEQFNKEAGSASNDIVHVILLVFFGVWISLEQMETDK